MKAKINYVRILRFLYKNECQVSIWRGDGYTRYAVSERGCTLQLLQNVARRSLKVKHAHLYRDSVEIIYSV